MDTTRNAALEDMYDAAIRWISADADHPDTPPPAWAKLYQSMTYLPELIAMLRAICDRASGQHADSTGQAMVKVRLALIDEARTLLARLEEEPA